MAMEQLGGIKSRARLETRPARMIDDSFAVRFEDFVPTRSRAQDETLDPAAE